MTTNPPTVASVIAIGTLNAATNPIATTTAAQGGSTFQMNIVSSV